MLAVHEYVTKAKEAARVRARITFTKAMTLLNISTGLELLHRRFSSRNGLSSSSQLSLGANSYDPADGISTEKQNKIRRQILGSPFAQESATYVEERMPISQVGLRTIAETEVQKSHGLMDEKNPPSTSFPITGANLLRWRLPEHHRGLG